MKEIDLSDYGPVISDEIVGNTVYSLIKDSLSTDDVVIDMRKIRSMATFCSKQIFGKLYKELGPQLFYDKIQIKGASPDVKVIIRIGILSEIKDE